MDQLLKNKKLLIAEDEPAMLNALAGKFTNEGCNVLKAEDGETAMSLAVKEQPDLILLDIIMPKMDGMRVLAKIRAESSWGKKVPIIILTSVAADDKIMHDVTKSEPSYYLIKANSQLDDIVEKAKTCLRAP